MFNPKSKITIATILLAAFAALFHNGLIQMAGAAGITALQTPIAFFTFSPAAEPATEPANEPAIAMATITWDGGGATNNWSDQDNWSSDTVPGFGDSVVFDGTSTKDSFIDLDLTILSLSINSGYNGTISSGTANLTVRSASTQDDGAFSGGSGNITFEQTFTQSGGTFAGNNSTLQFGNVFTLSGGTFTASSGNTNFNTTFNVSGTGAFEHNNGTVRFIGGGGSAFNINSIEEFNNVEINKSSPNAAVVIATNDVMSVSGTLNLIAGQLSSEGNDARLEAFGDVNFTNAFNGLTGNLHILGNATRTITIPSPARLTNLTINAPNTDINTTGSGVVELSNRTIIQNVNSMTNGSADFVFGSTDQYEQTGGTFNVGSGNITFGGTFTQSGGTFTGSSSTLQVVSVFTLSGGTFTASSGNTNFNTTFNVSGTGVFEHNNGTVRFIGGSGSSVNINNVEEFNNFEIDKSSGSAAVGVASDDVLRIGGTLNLLGGQLSAGNNNSRVEAFGDVAITTTFAGGAGNLHILGDAARTITFPTPVNLPNLTVNAPNVDIDTAGNGIVDFNSRTVIQNVNSMTNAAATFAFGSSDQYQQSGGTFTVGTGNITFGSLFTLSGGSFTGSDSTLQFNNVFTVSGGTFTASSGNTNFIQNFNVSGTGVYEHNNGTARFISASGTVDVVGSEDFNNVEIDKSSSFVPLGLGADDIMRVRGNLTLTNGQISTSFGNARFEAFGDVTISPTFAGGSGDLHYVGTANQTYTNNGGNNPSSIFRVDKPSGILTAVTDVILPSNTGMVINRGTLYLANGSDLTAGGAVTGLLILANGRLVSDSATTITLGGNLSNGGVVDLRGGGTCPAEDTILIRSNGAQRSWTGLGTNRLVNVDVQNMGGTGTKTVFNGTDSGSNNTSWVFDSGCPTGVSLNPPEVFVQSGQTFDFEASGGFAPYTFDILTNNTGGTINPSTGLYTAGANAGASDSIRVTDAFGSLDFSIVNTYGTATRVDFITQPTNTTAGQTISQVQVAVKDAGNRIVRNATNSVTLSISSNPAGGTLSGTRTRTPVDGVVTFDNLSIDRSGNSYILQAGATGGLTGDTSSAFNITAGPADKLGFVAQPNDSEPGVPLIFASVEVQDALGNRVLSASNSITMSLANNPTGGILSGTLTARANNGIVFFNDLSIDQPGIGFTLRAQAGSLTAAESQPFNISNPFAVTNTNDSGPGSLRQAILTANAVAGTQTISFNIPGDGPHTIQPQSFLPPITQSVIIDGTTQPGFAGTPIIEIDGTNAGNNGFNVRTVSGGVTIRGLVINRFPGIGIVIETGSGHVIQGNYIGTDVTGNLPLGNAGGIRLLNTSNVLIGGTSAGDGNLISSSAQFIGIDISGGSEISTTTRIFGNKIGTNADGTLPLPNPTGIFIENKGRVKVGGVLAGEGNIVANSSFGVLIGSTATRIPIRGNSIHSNGSVGIGLSGGSGRFNDPFDRDTGANNGQNFPVINTALAFSGSTTVNGTLNSEPSKSYLLDFYANDSCSPSGNGEGRTFLGSTQVSTDLSGLTGFSADLPVTIAAGTVITATATSLSPTGEPENTSEFSRCRESAAAIFSITGRILDLSGDPIANSFVLVNGFRTAFNTDSTGRYQIRNFPGGRDYTFRPSARGTTFLPSSRTVTNLSSDQIGQDFLELDPDISISGQVMSEIAGTAFPIENATVQLQGTTTGSVKTDANGRYSFSSLTSGGNYQVRVTKPNFNFPSDTRTFSNLTSDQTADFAGNIDPQPIGRVAYVSGMSIFTMNADGTASTRIHRFNSTGRINSPSYSSNGQMLVFGCNLDSSVGGSGIFTAKFDGSELTRIFSGNSVSPRFSPDGTRIAFDRGTLLRIMNSDGSGQTTVFNTNANGGGIIQSLDWSPDGSRIVFSKTSTGANQQDLFTINADGTNLTQLNLGGQGFRPRFSPDGTRIAFLFSAPTSNLARVGQIALINSNGSGFTLTSSPSNSTGVDWSPDGSFLSFTGGTNAYGVMELNGSNPRTLKPFGVLDHDLAPRFAPTTPAGNSVTVEAGAVDVTFDTVSTGGQTSVIPIPPNSTGTTPNGFVLGNQAYEISTTAAFTPAITVCFTVQGSPTLAQFNQMAILHNEGGTLVDSTVSRNFATKQICASVSSLSPFVLAEQIDTNLPSITGLILDDNGNPMSGVSVSLTGTEERQTETNSDGSFKFVNLTANGNYNVSPKQVGYLFEEYNTNFIDITEEETVFFEGTAADFQITGTVRDGVGNPLAGVPIELDGSQQGSVETDANGDYLFAGLPSDGTYFVTPQMPGFVFRPGALSISALTSNVSNADFEAFAPTAAAVTIAGRVMRPDGNGINRAEVTLNGPNGVIARTITNPFGYYQFDGEAGSTYIVSVSSKTHTFAEPSRVVNPVDNINDLNFVSGPHE